MKVLIRTKITSIVAILSIPVFFIHLVIFMSAFFNATLISPPATPLFEDKDGNYLTDFPNKDNEYGFWKIDGPIPPRIKEAFLMAEDREFYSHWGVNVKSLVRAFINNMGNNPIQGGSTIPMQIARMQEPKQRSVLNKLKEIYTALFLVMKYPREQLLVHYLRIIPQGNQMHGTAYASRRYFRKPLRDISWAEAALLASVIKAPGKMNLFSFEGSMKAAQRARIILTLLFKEGTLSADEYHTALEVLYSKSYQIREKRPQNSLHYLFRFLDSYREKYEKRESINYTRPIHTTLDPDLQDYLSAAASRSMARYRPFGAGNIAIIAADAKTGCILGYIGSENYYDKENDGAINYAFQPRSSGSTLKPFVYGLGLETKTFSPASILADLPFSILSTKGEYKPGNFDDDFLGPLLYRYALANSRNIPAIRVLDEIGIDKTYGYLKSLGLITGEKPAEYYGYGLAVGGVYVTLEQLITSYGILANDGFAYELHFENRDVKKKEVRHMSSKTARYISLFLSDPLARSPSFKTLSTLGFTFPIAIKTGTSQGYRDAWTIAYNADYIVGVWMGHPKNVRMNHVTGSETALIAYQIFKYLQPEKKSGLYEEPFPLPRAVIPRKICALSGKLAGMHCNNISVEYFEEGEEPHDYCGLHQEFAIDKISGKPASSMTPEDQVVTQSFTILPPEYAAWAARHGYRTPETVYENLKDAYITILHPHSGTRLIIDPETPGEFQSIPLQVRVNPVIPEVLWLVDGEEYSAAGFPYTSRWNLKQGIHTIQAKFARAHIYSEKITVEVKAY